MMELHRRVQVLPGSALTVLGGLLTPKEQPLVWFDQAAPSSGALVGTARGLVHFDIDAASPRDFESVLVVAWPQVHSLHAQGAALVVRHSLDRLVSHRFDRITAAAEAVGQLGGLMLEATARR